MGFPHAGHGFAAAALEGAGLAIAIPALERPRG
jgi:hypothetical protein